ncbi:hypothetical protein Syun_014582 [Stephania yunnanensis]|uniref:Uncharacterized protein n=1 Tax=Stephania yunnanensis TaxID=152371 RepID=A0AAP0JJU3_9MAGN
MQTKTVFVEVIADQRLLFYEGSMKSSPAASPPEQHSPPPPTFSSAPSLPKVITHLRNSSIPILPGLSDSELVRAEPSLASPSLPTSAPYSLAASPSPTPRLPRPPHLHHLLHGYTSKATYPNQIWPPDLNRRKGEAGRKGGGGWPAVDDDAALSMVGAHCA